MSVSIFAPASIGNVSVGFDVLGLAVKPVDGTLLGDVVTVTHSNFGDKLEVVGGFAKKLPSAIEDNIVWQCLLAFNQLLKDNQQQVAEVKITLEKRMPVGSGLGSSACSVVAAVAALNAFYDKYHNVSFEPEQLLKLMGAMEAKISGSLHYDNVAPCYLGGLQLMVPDTNTICRSLPTFDDCYYVMAYPGIEVSTKAARDILPTEYNRADTIAFGQNLATFVDGCYRQDKAQAFSVLTDVIAEPYRESLLPGYKQAVASLKSLGCLAVGISGSGPTLFCITDEQEIAEQAAKWLQQHYLVSDESGVSQGFVHVCQVADEGAVAVTESELAL